MNDKKISVLLVDDHQVVRAGFRMLLDSQPFIGDIVDVDRGEVACHEYERKRPDVVVMDLSMPGIGGLETIRRLKKQDPQATILVYSIHDESIYVERAIQAGAKGYVTKNSAAEVLAEAVLAVSQGKRYIEQDILPNIDDFKRMTAHEVAAELHLGYKTVANYNTQIKSKLNVNTTADLANIAVVLGIIKH